MSYNEQLQIKKHNADLEVLEQEGFKSEGMNLFSKGGVTYDLTYDLTYKDVKFIDHIIITGACKL